jgi:hypothetical protein
MELETAVRLKANIVHMVWIDGTYNMVAVQEKLKYGRTSGTDFGPIDYIKYAEAFGATEAQRRDRAVDAGRPHAGLGLVQLEPAQILSRRRVGERPMKAASAFTQRM